MGGRGNRLRELRGRLSREIGSYSVGLDGWDREIMGECGSGGSGGGDEAQSTTFMLFGNDSCK